MAKTIIIIVMLLILWIVLYATYIMEINPLSLYETRMIRIGNANLKVFVADTMEKRTQGLMGVSELATDTGMLFIFPDSLPRTFWNKNTLVPLDLIWIARGRVVGISSLSSITENNGQIVTVPSSEAVDQVVEVNTGWVKAHGIEVGNGVEWTTP